MLNNDGAPIPSRPEAVPPLPGIPQVGITDDDTTLLKAFDTHLRFVEDRSPTTIATYTIHARLFHQYLETNHPGVTLVTAKTMHVKAYLLNNAARGIAPITRATALYALRSLYRFLLEEKLVTTNPTDPVRRPPGIKLRTDVYSEADAERILVWAAKQKGLRWQVGHALLATLRYTGLRLSELVNLTVDEVDMESRRISLIGKGDKSRVVPIPQPLAVVLTEYFATVRPKLPASPLVFANPRSTQPGHHQGGYGPRSVGNLVKAAGEGAGVSGRHFPHRWRHTYATSLLRREVDLHHVQRLLGHSGISTTTRYLHLSDTDLAIAVDRAFPAD